MLRAMRAGVAAVTDIMVAAEAVPSIAPAPRALVAAAVDRFTQPS